MNGPGGGRTTLRRHRLPRRETAAPCGARRPSSRRETAAARTASPVPPEHGGRVPEMHRQAGWGGRRAPAEVRDYRPVPCLPGTQGGVGDT